MLYRLLLILSFISFTFAIEPNERNITITGNSSPSSLDFGYYIPNFSNRDILLFNKLNLSDYSNKYLYVGYGVFDKKEQNCKYLDLEENKNYFTTYFKEIHTIGNDTYAISLIPYTYQEAKELVNRFGGIIAAPNNSVRNSFLLGNLYKDYDVWIGLERKDCVSEWKNELNVSVSFTNGVNQEYCDSNLTNLFSPANSIKWEFDSPLNKHYVLIHILSPDYKRPIRVCAPWWRIERTYKKELSNIDPNIENSLKIFKYIFPPKRTKLCTKYNITSYDTTPKIVECLSYYSSKADPICSVDLYNDICYINQCKGYIESTCKLLKEVKPYKDYTFTYIKDTTTGEVKKVKEKDKIVNHIYECPPMPPTLQECQEASYVEVYPAECPGSNCNAIVECIKSGKSEAECLESNFCEVTYGSIDSLDIDENGNVLGLYGKCSDGSIVEAKINRLTDTIKKCVEYEKITEINTTIKYCDAEATSTTHSLQSDITTSDIYERNESCIRINNLQEARPDDKIFVKVDNLGNFHTRIIYSFTDKEQQIGYDKVDAVKNNYINNYVNSKVSLALFTQKSSNTLNSTSSYFSDEWFDNRIKPFGDYSDLIGIVRATNDLELSINSLANSLQICRRYADLNQRDSTPWECVGVNEALLTDFVGDVDSNDDFDVMIKGDANLDLQICRRYADLNQRDSAPWECKNINEALLTDFIGDVDSNDDFDLMLKTDNPTLAKQLMGLQLCRRYADNNQRESASWVCAGINEPLLTDFVGDVDSNDDFDLMLRFTPLSKYKYLYIFTNPNSEAENNLSLSPIIQENNSVYAINFSNLKELGIDSTNIDNFYFYGSNLEIAPSQFSVFKRDVNNSDLVDLISLDIPLLHSCKEYADDLDNSEFTLSEDKGCIIYYPKERPLNTYALTDINTSLITDLNDTLILTSNGYNSIFAIETYSNNDKFEWFSTYMSKPIETAILINSDSKRLTPIFEYPYVIDTLTYQANIYQRAIRTKTAPPIAYESFASINVWQDMLKTYPNDYSDINDLSFVKDIITKVLVVGLTPTTISLASKLLDEVESGDFITDTILQTSLGITSFIENSIANTLTYIINMFRNSVKFYEYKIHYKIYKTSDKFYDHSVISPKRAVIKPTYTQPYFTITYDDTTYDSGIVKDINKKITDFTSFKNLLLQKSGFEKSVIDSLIDDMEKEITISPPTCKWWQSCDNKESSTSKTITKTITKKVTTAWSGAVNMLTIYVPYLGDYELRAFDKYNNLLSEVTIKAKDFIQTSTTLNYQKVNFAMSDKFNIDYSIKDGNNTNACRYSSEVEWGGGVSGANYEIHTPE